MEQQQRGNRLPKSYRLSGQVHTDRLFAFGQTLKAWPFRVIYRQEPCKGKTAIPRMVISVPKRQFKHATDRNRIRRQCKEVYRQVVRLSLQPVVEDTGLDLHIALIYTGGTTKISPEELQKKLSSALQRLAKEILTKGEGNTPPSA